MVGPTAVGKSALAVKLAEYWGTSVVSIDSRQVFREMRIGTAVPSEDEMSGIPHYFIQTKSVKDYYSAGMYEVEALAKLDELFNESRTQVAVGGSMLYVDALLNGLDDIPRISDDVRNNVKALYDERGLDGICSRLRDLDPEIMKCIDTGNRQRTIHALEVTMQAGRPYSTLLGKRQTVRNFDVIKIGLNMPREELYDRINRRVDIMMDDGLEDEARYLLPLRTLNPLNTVGYKELFNYFDGMWTKDFAVNMIKQDSRRYAKRQLTWFNADDKITWFLPSEYDKIINFVTDSIKV